jgi:hypothetical protein
MIDEDRVLGYGFHRVWARHQRAQRYHRGQDQHEDAAEFAWTRKRMFLSRSAACCRSLVALQGPAAPLAVVVSIRTGPPPFTLDLDQRRGEGGIQYEFAVLTCPRSNEFVPEVKT